MQLTLENGDDFERRNAEWIRTTLPDYERVWAAFIGNNQSSPARPLEMPGLSEELQRSRKKFYQAHYSVARKLFLFQRLIDEIVESLGDGSTYDQFEASEDRLFRFGSYLGFIYDMFEQIAAALKAEDTVYADLKGFFQQRCHIIHTPQIPHLIEDGLLKIPKIAAAKGAEGEWHKDSVWDDFELKDFVFLSDFVQDTAKEFYNAVRNSHAKIFNAADRRFEKRRIACPDNTADETSEYFDPSDFTTRCGPLPASTVTPNISGEFCPPAYSTLNHP